MNPPLPKEIIVFLHLAKTAGSSARALLAGQFEADAVHYTRARPRNEDFLRYLTGELPAPPPWKGVSANQLLAEELSALPAERRARLRLVVGHYWYGVHEALPRPGVYVTLLRDPVERALSLHAQRLRIDGFSVSLEDYVREARDVYVDNGQVRRLAGLPPEGPRFPITDETLELAKRHLEQVRVVGLTERFDEFVVLLSREFGWRGLTAPSLNRTPARPRAHDVDPSVLEGIRALNRADQALYEHAVALIAARTASDRDRIDMDIRRLRSRTARRESAARMTSRFRAARSRLARALRTGDTAEGP